MRYRGIYCVLFGQIPLHDEVLRGAKEKARSRQDAGAVVLGAMVVGLAAFVGYAGAGLGEHTDRGAVLATWLVITFGGAGISWVTASLLFSMGTQAGHDIAQPIAYRNYEKAGDVNMDAIDNHHGVSEEKFYRTLARSCVVALRSREEETARIMAGASRAQSALLVGLAVMGMGAVAALAALGPWA
ncbi:MAG: hypothetical protein OXU25_02555 [Thaumarchaeota archaeon]|nr:hypothetical protein [Nitrososphaerota archaeon]